MVLGICYELPRRQQRIGQDQPTALGPMAGEPINEQEALARLRQRWTRFVDSAGNPDGLRVALQGLGVESISPSDFGKVSADNEAFSGWIARMKDKFRTGQPAGSPARAGR